jgi:hypothetical protein
MSWDVRLVKSGESDIVASNVIRVSGNEITCDFNLSGAASGLWDIVVTNDEGRFDTLIGGFEVIRTIPEVTSVDPGEGYQGSSVNLEITGTDFAAGDTVELRKLGETTIHATDVVVESSVKITCTVDLSGAALGDWDVVVINSELREGILAAGFEVLAVPDPTILTVNPTSGGVNKLVTISGVNFGVSQEQSKVFFRSGLNLFEAEISSWGSAEIICYSPEIPRLGAWDIVVRIVSNE